MSKTLQSFKLVIISSVFFFIYWKDVFRHAQALFTEAPSGKNKHVSELLDLKDFKYLINPKTTCTFCTHDFFQIILVLSATTHFQKRRVIRKSLKRSTNCIKTVFLLGTSNRTNVTEAIHEESRQFGDILQGNIVDSYRNLTYKHLMGLKWATEFCTQSKYIIKIDDDYHLLIDVYYKMLAEDFWGKNQLLCEAEKNKFVFRDDYYKWAVRADEFEGDIYPTYCNGNSIIIYPAEVARLLLEESPKVPFFWIDDVFITGILAQRLSISHYELHWTRLYNQTKLI